MSLTLLSAAETAALDIGINEYATGLYPGITFDTALPQGWVDACIKRGFDPRGEVVLGYLPGKGLFGQPLPLTLDAMLAMCAFAGYI